MRMLLPGLCLLLAACGSNQPTNEADLAALDAELTEGQSANGADPQVMAALQDQIMVDPQLAAKSNADAVRPAPQPYAAPVPHPGIAAGSAARDEPLMKAPAPRPFADATARQAITLGALARAKGGKSAAACTQRLAYSAAWADRLPADLPLHPDARVNEAAGVEGDGCSMRVVSFYVGKPAAGLIDWYYTRAMKAGFSPEHQAHGATHMIGGTRRDGLATVIFLTDRGDGGTDIDLIVGR
jgi:hypothetical protein